MWNRSLKGMQAYKLLNAPIIAYLVTYGANKLVSGNLKILKKFVCSGRERGLENSKKFRCGGRDRPWNILAELLLTEKKKTHFSSQMKCKVRWLLTEEQKQCRSCWLKSLSQWSIMGTISLLNTWWWRDWETGKGSWKTNTARYRHNLWWGHKVYKKNL